MSGIAWIVSRLTKRASLALGIALIGSALFFALLHLDRPLPADPTVANIYRAALLTKYTLAGIASGMGYSSAPGPPVRDPLSRRRECGASRTPGDSLLIQTCLISHRSLGLVSRLWPHFTRSRLSLLRLSSPAHSPVQYDVPGGRSELGHGAAGRR